MFLQFILRIHHWLLHYSTGYYSTGYLIIRLLQERPKKTRHRSKKKQKKPRIVKRDRLINLSNAPLSEGEITLLSRGLSFCPRPSKIDGFQLKEDINQFSKRLRLRECFNNPGEDNTNQNKNPSKEISKWTPPVNTDLALEIYITRIKEEIDHELD